MPFVDTQSLSILFCSPSFVRPFVRSPLHVLHPRRRKKDSLIAIPADWLYQVQIYWPGRINSIRSSTPLCCRQILGNQKKIYERGGTSTIRNRVSETRPATISIYDEPSLSLPPRPPLSLFRRVCRDFVCLLCSLDQIKKSFIYPPHALFPQSSHQRCQLFRVLVDSYTTTLLYQTAHRLARTPS